MKKFIHTGEFPWSSSFYVWDGDGAGATVERMLSWYRPDLVSLGAGKLPPTAPLPDHIIVWSADWPNAFDELPEHFRSRSCLFLVPFDDSHQYFDVFRHMEMANSGGQPLPSGHDVEWFKSLMEKWDWAIRLPNDELLFTEGIGSCLSQRNIDFNMDVSGSTLQSFYDQIISSLSDYESKEAFRSLFHASQEEHTVAYCRNLGRRLQYFDVAALKPGDVVINGGVGTGAELPILAGLLEGSGKIISFDPLGFASLNKNALGSIRAFPHLHRLEAKGLANYTGPGKFPLDGGQAVGSKLNALAEPHSRSIEVQVHRLDDYVREHSLTSVDFIKMDLEGGEMMAINGMKETIEHFEPVIAASIYHSIPEYFFVPLQLISLCRNHRFFVRSYGSHCNETMFYAVPHSRPLVTMP